MIKIVKMDGRTEIAISLEVDDKQYLLTRDQVAELIRRANGPAVAAPAQSVQTQSSSQERFVPIADPMSLAAVGVFVGKMFEKFQATESLDRIQQQRLVEALNMFDGNIGPRASSQVSRTLAKMLDWDGIGIETKAEIKRFLGKYGDRLERLRRRATYGAILRAAKAAVGAGAHNPQTVVVMIERMRDFDGWIPPDANSKELLAALKAVLDAKGNERDVKDAIDEFVKKQELDDLWSEVAGKKRSRS